MKTAKREDRTIIWVSVLLLLLLVFVYLVSSILLPFAAGMVLAYFLDPVADRLERLGLSRTWATILITAIFFSLLIFLLLLLIPTIQTQITSFITKLPAYIAGIRTRISFLIAEIKAYVSPAQAAQLQTAMEGYAGSMFSWAGKFATSLLRGGLAVFNLLSLLFITPVVTFYLLRDWNTITRTVDRWFPRQSAAVIREQLSRINEVLAGFMRGQALVCLSLSAIYGIGLTFVGLDLGLIVGLGAGAVSFIPYLGSISGFLIGMGLAIAQSPDWVLPGMVAGVFAIGQLTESYVLTPRLVGDRVGLHPVWIIFALLAGGALFGFLGLLIAVPVAAAIGVLARFALMNYMNSPLYQSSPPISEEDGTPSLSAPPPPSHEGCS